MYPNAVLFSDSIAYPLKISTIIDVDNVYLNEAKKLLCIRFIL